VAHDLHPFTDVLRPDNVVYVREAFGGAWLTSSGADSTVVAEALRLPVTVDRSGAIARLHTTIDADLLAPHLDTSRTTIYAIVYTYLLVDPGPANLAEVEFGALEVTPALGGFSDATPDPWRDADVYDLAFVGAGQTQATILGAPVSPGATDDTKVVVLATPGAGVRAIELDDAP